VLAILNSVEQTNLRVSEKFKEHFFEFCQLNLVKEIRKVREAIGLKGQERANED